MIELFNKGELLYISKEELEQGLNNGTIKEVVVKVDEAKKRPYKSAETIFNELKDKGVEVAVKNGVYCKVIGNTLEAINEQTKIDDYIIYELVEA